MIVGGLRRWRDGYLHPVPVASRVAQTTTFAFAVIRPVKPFMDAVMAVDPVLMPEVASPVELMLATAGAFDFQVTRLVMSRVVLG